jgi:hypothetical protein
MHYNKRSKLKGRLPARERHPPVIPEGQAGKHKMVQRSGVHIRQIQEMEQGERDEHNVYTAMETYTKQLYGTF